MIDHVASVSKSDIRANAVAFSARFADAQSEQCDRQTFWNEFFAIFKIDRRQVAAFEQIAKRSSTGNRGWVDLLYPGEMAVEHKSKGESLDAAMVQLLDYMPRLTRAQHPWLLIACDFQTFKWQNLTTDASGVFALVDLADNIDLFSWLAGYGKPGERFENEKDVNLKAAELLARIHDRLAVTDEGFSGHSLREWLTRVLFCLFADSTRVWGRAAFRTYIALHTSEDGTDLGQTIAYLFQILNTDSKHRPKKLDEEVAQFTYINGDLFSKPLPIPTCDATIREHLLEACNFNWSSISPAIFGSMFQYVMDPLERRRLGAHYTTERHILRVIQPLFLDELASDLESADTKPKLRAFLDRLVKLRFLDPACGCGNFLVVAYRELRHLETDALRRLRKLEERDSRGNAALSAAQLSVDVTLDFRVRVDQFYGIECEEFPAKIARTALYLIDHLANQEVSKEFGQHYVRFPIPAAPNIIIGNALRMDWSDVLPPANCSYILGNPPYVGKKERTVSQRADMDAVFGTTGGVGVLDYVAGWYKKAINYMVGVGTKAAFVSTNSITAGEQPPTLWKSFGSSPPEIHFAHRTFNWKSEAPGAAHVHCVIIGFAMHPPARPRQLFDYTDIDSEPFVGPAGNINAYLVDGPNVLVHKRRNPLLSTISTAREGSKLGDWGHLTFDEQTVAAVQADPVARKYLRPLVGAEEMLNDLSRWCLWLDSADPSDIRSSPLLQRHVADVRKERLESDKPTTKSMADKAGSFLETRQPSARYLLLPCVSSSRRKYIPMKFYDADTVIRTPSSAIEGASLFEFGYLHSAMFMAWVRTVSGRLKSDYQVAAGTVYNTFPFVEAALPQKQKVEQYAEQVLQVRASYPGQSLADLYDPLAMPSNLVDAHLGLDQAIDALYAPRKKFVGDADRLKVLFDRYVVLTNASQLVIKSGESRPSGKSKSRREAK